MDDLIVIILTILIVIIGALNQLKKQKQAAKQPEEKNPEPGIWETLFDESEDVELQTVGQSMEVQQEPFQLESTEPEITDYRFGQTEEGRTFLFQREPESSGEGENVQVADSLIEGIGEEFTLRKAVVYSEILNTKYF